LILEKINNFKAFATPTGFELPAGHFRKTEARRDLATVFGLNSGDSVPAGRSAWNRGEPSRTAEESAVVATTWQQKWPRSQGLGIGLRAGRSRGFVPARTAANR
jgi:hypothetical protein